MTRRVKTAVVVVLILMFATVPGTFGMHLQSKRGNPLVHPSHIHFT